MNRVVSGNSTTVKLTPVANVIAPAFAFEGPLAVFYTRDATAGQKAEPAAFATTIEVEKTLDTTVIAVGDTVNLDVATQKQLLAGTAGGVCVEASASGDKMVKLRLNSQ